MATPSTGSRCGGYGRLDGGALSSLPWLPGDALRRAPDPPGGEITVGRNPSPEAEDALWPWEVTFDGGASPSANGAVAGAGAALWRHNVGGGGPTCVARTSVAIPWGASAPLAEAIGCRAALDLLRQVGGSGRRARVVGDNLGVVRYGAGTARLRAQAQHAVLEEAFSAVLSQGWQLDRQAVRRHLNREADRLAMAGALWARSLRGEGVASIRARTEWTEGAPGDIAARL